MEESIERDIQRLHKKDDKKLYEERKKSIDIEEVIEEEEINGKEEISNEKEIKEEMFECGVCLMPCSIKGKFVECQYPNCKNRVCDECVPIMVEFSFNEKIIPKCTRNGCKGVFLRNEFLIFPKTIVQKYDASCLCYLVKKNEDISFREIENSKLIIKMREERRIFINTRFPVAIAKVAEVCLHKKLRKLEKKKKELVGKMIASSTRMCINLTCRGYLNHNFICITCNTTFCKECEKRKDTSIHECKKDDVDSLYFIKIMIKCPTCFIPIQKSTGCDNMICANCGTCFNYKNGMKNQDYVLNPTIILKKHHLLSDEYATILKQNDLTDIIINIEGLKPENDKNDRLLINIVSKYFTIGSDKKQEFEKKSSKALQKHYHILYFAHIFQDILLELERRLSSRIIIKSDFKKLYDKLLFFRQKYIN